MESEAGRSPSELLGTNQRVWDQMAEGGEPLCRPATDADLARPLETVDPLGWLGGDIRHQRVLCLAAGGGRQSALYAAAGAIVTVVDLSPAMLRLDREVAAERGFDIRTIAGSMDQLPMLRDGEFDVVIQPVSTCYVPDVRPVFAEVARLVRPGGVYVSQHKSPVSLQASTDPVGHAYALRHAYYRSRPVPPPPESSAVSRRLRESGAIEYLHRWEQLIGGMCRAGFVIEDLVEPLHAGRDAARGSFAHRANYIAPYVRIKARRRGQPGPRRLELV